MEVVKRQNALLITLVGRLDMQSAQTFEKNFVEKCLNSDVETIGLNMANLRFLDSSGLSILMKLTNEANKIGKKVYYISLSSTILSVIKIARLDSLLHFISEEEFNRKFPVIQGS